MPIHKYMDIDSGFALSEPGQYPTSDPDRQTQFKLGQEKISAGRCNAMVASQRKKSSTDQQQKEDTGGYTYGSYCCPVGTNPLNQKQGIRMSEPRPTVKTALLRTIEKIKTDPKTANVVFRAETELKENVRCIARVREFETLIVDEPTDLGGTNAAMNPVELVLVALGTCQEIMYAAYAAVLGIPLTEVKVDVKGYLNLQGLFGMDPSIPPGYQTIVWETRISSPADEGSLKSLVAIVERTCPLLDVIRRPIEASGKVFINGNPEACSLTA
ncbi:MAG: OsmC family protein [Acidobacteriaceae bacterium]